jgi:hypothetical protein
MGNVLYFNSKKLAPADLRTAVENGNKALIGDAMTGKAGQFTMFKPVHTADNSTPTDKQVGDYVRGMLAKRYSDTLNELVKSRILKVKKGSSKTSYELSSKYIDMEGSVDTGLQFWLFNKIINNVEFNKMFTSDLAMYTSAIDYFKRVPSITSDGQYMATRNNSKYETVYNVSIIKEIVARSEYIKNYSDAMKNIVNSDELLPVLLSTLSIYNDINLIAIAFSLSILSAKLPSPSINVIFSKPSVINPRLRSFL